MNKDITLLVMAAGIGSRFGGLKQITPVGPNDEFIIDYSVYDAKQAGFTKVVFLIKEENYEDFKNTIGKRVEGHIPVEYVFQKNGNLPPNVEIPKERKKPLGTAHAILCCKEVIHEPFAIINADDFYGRDAYVKAIEFLRKRKTSELEAYGMIGYRILNTLTEAGAVKRGICSISDNHLLELIESSVKKEDGKIMATPLNGEDSFEVSENTTVSMNMLLFQPSVFSYLEKDIVEYLEREKENLLQCEYLIPDCLFDMVKKKFADVEVIPTTAKWHGVTYPEDLVDVKNAINELISNGEYKINLWDES